MQILTIKRASGVSIEWCRDEAVPEVQAFLDAHWRKGHVLARDARLVRWQFRTSGGTAGLSGSAGTDRLSVLVARRGDEIIGTLGVIRAGFCDWGRRLEAGWLANWVVPAKYRASGAGLQLLRRAIDEFDVVGTLGGNATTLKILGTLGFETCPAMPRWIRIFDREALEHILSAAGDPCARQEMTEWLDGRRQSTDQDGGSGVEGRCVPGPWTLDPRPGIVCTTGLLSGRGSISVTDWHRSLAPSWDVCWRDRFAPVFCGTWRDSDYLRRRYVQHPSFRYEIRLAADADGNARGLLVYRPIAVEGCEARVLRVVEFLADDEAAPLLAEDLAAAGKNAAYADLYCPSASVGRQLAARGFVRADALPVTPPARFRPLDMRSSDVSIALCRRDARGQLLDSPDLYVTSADCDQDRPN